MIRLLLPLCLALFICGSVAAKVETAADAETHYNLALALKHKGDLKAALPEFSEAVRLKPSWSAAHYGLGAALYELGDKANGKLQLLKAVELDPNNSAARRYLGSVLLSSGLSPRSSSATRSGS